MLVFIVRQADSEHFFLLLNVVVFLYIANKLMIVNMNGRIIVIA
jgi:hypothetical protein